MTQNILLLPRPQSTTLTGGSLTILPGQLIALENQQPADLLKITLRVQQAIQQHTHIHWDIVGGSSLPQAQIGLSIGFDSSLQYAQGYRLTISPERITVRARDHAGAFYAVMTLAQLLHQLGSTLPALVIDDWPDLPTRGVMLDISRDKVPTMSTLFALIDKLASWKINQFQLYTEHTFAYRQHPLVWANASPLTAQEILTLDAYCRERFIDLVPNQNSFGHMHRWLIHPEYAHLAEVPEGVETPWGKFPYGLAPTKPDSLKFLDGLYAELLPNFTSRYFNVGCDETFDLGLGHSKAACEARGKGRVYLEFLLNIYQRVQQHGRTMQFWGDIIGQYPDLVPELPRDVIALEWGYEINHPYPEKCALFARSGIPFYVCPSVSAWLSIGGRTDNTVTTIRNAVRNGLEYGAQGILNTDWGDWGHWQPLPVSYLSYAWGAALGWAYAANVGLDLPAALDAFAFEDKASVMGKLAYDLGNAYQKPGILRPYSSILFWFYHYPLSYIRQHWRDKLIEVDQNLDDDQGLKAKLRLTLDYIDDVLRPLPHAQMQTPDARLITREFTSAAAMLRLGAQLALLQLGDGGITKPQLRADLNSIEAEFRALWLERNRPGGLDDSTGRMAAARAMTT